MKNPVFLSALEGQNGNLRERLLQLEIALQQVEYGNFRKCQQAITELRGLCRYLEDLSEHRFRQEEEILFPAVEHAQPQLQNLLDELRHEHNILRGMAEQFRRQLARFNATGESGELLALGRQVLRLLRHHVVREEHALLPIVFQR